MTNTSDSFINEVTEEVQRDRLYGLFRRYGWIGLLLVVLIVGGAAFVEWRKAQERAAAEGLGDALLAGLESDDAADRAAALAAIETDSDGAVVSRMLAAAEMVQAGDRTGAVALLRAVAGDGSVPLLYRDLAQLKALMLGSDAIPAEDRRLALDVLAAPGAPFAPLAQEQLALLELELGDEAAALERLRALSEDAAAGRGLRERADALIVALGGDADAGADDGAATE